MDSHKDNLQIIDTLRRLNRIFVRTRDLKDLLSELCDTLVSAGQFSSVWMVVVTRTGEIIQFESNGLGEHATTLKERLFKEGLNHCARLSIEKGKPFFVEKNEETCSDCPLLQDENFSKTLSLPVYFQKDLLGVVAICVKPGYELSDLENSLLLEFSDDLGNAINTIQLEQGRERLVDTMNRLTKSISGNSSKEVLDSFMQNLIQSLNGDYAFIGRLIPGYEDRIRTITVGTPAGIIENFEYTLKGTPCEKVIQMDICCYPGGVANAFPDDIMLKDMGIEAYIGTPLMNSRNEIEGLMVVLKKSPFKSETLARYIFQVFAARASSELMRYDTEQRILESENQYQNLIENSKNPIYIIVGTNYALVNSAWLQMFEYSIEEVKSPNFSIHKIASSESLDLIQVRLDNFLAGIGQPFQYELKAVSKSGKKYDLDVSVTHLNWQGKRAVQGVYRNITGAKRKERQLQNALKVSRESSQMKTAFLSNLSHEIISNLVDINKKADDLVNKQDKTASCNGFAEYIVESSSKLLEHINDIQDISDIELGKISLKPEKFVLQDLLKDVVNYFSPAAQNKGIELKCCKKRYDSAYVNADPVRVRQILINLISNAVKFTDQGQVSINYDIRQDDVRISVADTGIGIAPDKLQEIYKSFIDPNGKLAGNYNGNGLGLKVTRSLVQLMNGKIWVESDSGGGTIFYFTIPLA